MMAIAAASSNGIYAFIGAGVGAAVGAACSLGGVVFTTRQTGSQARQQRLASLRQERKEAILKFLEIAQQVERIAEDRYFRRSVTNPEESTHRMWVLQKSLDLVGTKPLRDAARNYAVRLNDAAYEDLPDMKIWDFIGQEREPFLEAARKVLDVPDL